MKRILFIAVVTIVTICGFTFFTSQSGADAHSPEEHGHDEATDFDNIALTQKQLDAVDLRMAHMERRELDATLHVSGQLVLRAQAMADVSPLMGGIVKEVRVKEGDRVARGQVVATVENADVVSLQREYYTASREAEMARLELQRQQTLQQSGAGVKKTLQQATKDARVAEAAVVGIGRQLQQLGIAPAQVARGRFTTVMPLRAPIGGTVARLTASLGSYADMQTPLMQIRDNSAVEADLNVFEKDLAHVKRGDRVVLTLTNQPGVKVAGTVYGLNEYFNDGTKAVAAHVRLQPAAGVRLFDGMFVEGTIATGRQTCDVLPSKALVSADGKTYIFLLNSGPKGGRYSFSRHEVTAGVTQGGFTAVTPCEHLTAARRVVTDGAFYLASMTSEHGEHEH